jgi:hypothetical protein
MSGASKPKIDWTFPIWGVLVAAGQALVIIWWAAGMSAKVETTAQRVDKLEGRVSAVETNSAETRAVLARIDERLNWIMEELKTRKAKS